MDEPKRASILEDLAGDAGRKREAFIGDAGRTFARFIDANKYRLRELGGLVLIDDEPEYLFVTEEGRFRSRSRFQDENGEWVADSEEFEDASELVEVYNPADLYAAFADAAREEADLVDEGEGEAAAAGDEVEAEDATESGPEGEDAEAAEDAEDEAPAIDDDWVDEIPTPRDQPHAARLMYDLALTFQERSQLDQAGLLDEFQDAAAPVAAVLGDAKIVEDDDERIWFRASGGFEGEVLPERDQEESEGEPEWQPLTSADDMVQFYDPTDLFGDLAEAIAETYPEAAPEADEEAEALSAAGDDEG